MFPLSPNFIEIFQVVLIFSVCTVSFIIAWKWKILLAVPIIVGWLVYKWQYNVLLLAHADQVSYGIMFIGIVLLIAASAFWVFIIKVVLPFAVRNLRHFSEWEPNIFLVLFFAISPAFILLTPAFVRQTVPSIGKCVSDRVSLALGTLQFEIFHEFGARISLSSPIESRRTKPVYSTALSHKESLRIICGLSENGEVAIRIDEVKVHPVSIAEDLENTCVDSSRFSHDFCTKLSSIEYQRILSVRLTNNPKKYLGTMSSWFDHVDDPTVSTGGDMDDGYVCHGTDNTNEIISCTVWFPFDANISVVSSSMNYSELGFRNTTKAEVLNKTRSAINFTLGAFKLAN